MSHTTEAVIANTWGSHCPTCDAVGRHRLARALDVSEDQDIEAVWHEIERKVDALLDYIQEIDLQDKDYANMTPGEAFDEGFSAGYAEATNEP